MNKLRPFILVLAVVAATVLAAGVFTRPSPQPLDAEGFSSARVYEDLKIIAQEPHSVEHPEARAKVRDYLFSRLNELGADTTTICTFDTTTERGYTFVPENVYAEFHPQKELEDTTYIMMIAHYDSRYAQPVLKDTVWSYGAADDGYGLGIILETVNQALRSRDQWYQGFKVLFTDAEEVGMKGAYAMFEYHPEVFKNVGMVINVEARGPYGPALLFEISDGNSELLKLYGKTAKSPATYSLTTVVYKFMTNFTDFTVVREKSDIPGLNFSTIADINHYHTDLDNIDNVSQKSIQHFGAQISPLVLKYLTTKEYANKDYFKSEEDSTNFTIPLLGFFNFSKFTYLIINIVLALVFIGLFVFEILRGRLDGKRALRNSLNVLLGALTALILGEILAYLCAVIVGAEFKAFGAVRGISFDNIAMLVMAILMIGITILLYLRGRKEAHRKSHASMRASASYNALSKYAMNNLMGTLFIMMVLGLVLVFVLGENLMFLIPLSFATVAIILWRATNMKFWLLAAIFCTLLHTVSFYFALAMALTIGAVGAILFLAFFDVVMLIALSDLYLLHKGK